MEVVRSLDFYIPSIQFEEIFDLFNKIDHVYSDCYPGNNMVNYKFLLKYLAEYLDFYSISEQIPITWSHSKIMKWKNKIDEVVRNLRRR